MKKILAVVITVVMIASAMALFASAEGETLKIYVGDTETDRVSSKEAGVDFIYADYGFGTVADAQFYISEIGELPGVIERVFKNR